MNTNLFLSAFVTLFVIVDPIGTAAVFGGITQTLSRNQATRLAMKAILIAGAIYALFGVFGPKILMLMGLGFAAFRIAGGILLFVTAYRMVMGWHEEDKSDSAGAADADKSNLAIFPLAIPLLAGPGCLTAFLLLIGTAQSGMDIGTVIAALIGVQLAALAACLCAGELRRKLGDGFMMVTARIMGILLAAMSVQFVINGLKAALILPG